MTAMIRIVKTPDGEGFSVIRDPYVGCTFRLADPTQVQETEAMYYSQLQIELPAAYSVTFAEVVNGLRQIERDYWANHLQMLQRPKLIRFPVDCAELIGTT